MHRWTMMSRQYWRLMFDASNSLQLAVYDKVNYKIMNFQKAATHIEQLLYFLMTWAHNSNVES